MTVAGQLKRRVTFRRRALDANQDRLGEWGEFVTCSARVKALTGTEAVQGQRLAGLQPVVITVNANRQTRTLDSSYSVLDARNPAILWDVTSVIETEDRAWIEVLALQRKAGDE